MTSVLHAARARARPNGALVGCALATAFGCGAVFGIDPSPPAEAGGASGTTSSGGALSGGTAGAGLGGGGTSAAGAGESAGGSAATDATGGADSASGMGASAGMDAGSGGDDGNPPDPPVPPEATTPCFAPGTLACDSLRRSMLCQGGLWSFYVCPGVCDPTTGACGRYAEYCKDNPSARKCLAGELVSCTPNGISRTFEPCLFGCDESVLDAGRCAPPSAGQIVVHPPPATITRTPFWPDQPIPICIDAESAADAGADWTVLRDLLRSEAETTWNRHAGASFDGWQACDASSPGVRITFLRECDAVLGHADAFGYPGPGGRSSFGICLGFRSADDEPGSFRTADGRLLRFLARHQLGHALGFQDVSYRGASPVMQRGIELANVDAYRLGGYDIGLLQNSYGRKPPRAVVSARGACLAASGANGLRTAPCDASPAQAFRPLGRQLRLADGRCLLGVGQSAVLGRCGAEPSAADTPSTWELPRVQWRGHGGYCATVVNVAPGSAPDDELQMSACEAFGVLPQTFSFEFLDLEGRVRIRHTATNRCVRAPPQAVLQPLEPLLGACDGTRDRFDVTSSGQIAFGGYCVGWPSPDFFTGSSRILFNLCLDSSPYRWSLSGPIQRGANALTLSPDGGVRVAALQDPPLFEQIFDLDL